jgi:hypothetical protein
MAAHGTHACVQLNACNALYELGLCHSQLYRAACVRAGASDALLRVLRAHADSELAALAATRALGPLTVDLREPTAAEQLLNRGASLLAGAVCDTMRRHPAHEAMQYFSAVVMNNLMMVPLVQQRACGASGGMRSLGAVPLLLDALSAHSGSVRVRFAACNALSWAAPAVSRAAGAAGACEAVVRALLACCGHGGGCACGGGGPGANKHDARACATTCRALHNLTSEQPDNAARFVAAGAFPALLRVARVHLRDHEHDESDIDEVFQRASLALSMLLQTAPQHALLAATHAGALRVMTAAVATHRNGDSRLVEMACSVLMALPPAALHPAAAAETVPAAAAVAGAMMSRRCGDEHGVQWGGCKALCALAGDLRATAKRGNNEDDASAAAAALAAARAAASAALLHRALPASVRSVAAAAVGALAAGHDGARAAAATLTAALARARSAREEHVIIACADALGALAARCAPASAAAVAREGALRELEAVGRAAPRGGELAAAVSRAAGALRAAADAAAARAAAELLAEEAEAAAAAAAVAAGKPGRKKRGGGGGGAGSGPAANAAGADAAPSVDADADASAPAPAPAAEPSAVAADGAPAKSRRRRNAASRAAAAAAAGAAGGAGAAAVEPACVDGATADAAQQQEEQPDAEDAAAAAAKQPPSSAADAVAAAQDALAALTVQPPAPAEAVQLPLDERATDAEGASGAAAPDVPPAPAALPVPPAPDAPDAPPARRTAPRAYQPPMGAAPPPVDGAPSFLPPPPPTSDGGGGASGACGSSSALALPPPPAAAAVLPVPPPPPPPAPVTKECVVCLDDVAQAELRLLLPCGHRCVCERCADALLARQPPSARTCPLCVAAMTLAMRIFDI